MKTGRRFGEISFVFFLNRAIIGNNGESDLDFREVNCMENALRMIVEADSAARASVEAAEQRRENLTAELAENKVQIAAQYRENAEKAVEKVRSHAQTKVETAVADSKRQTAEKAARMQAVYDENADRWVQEIVNRVINPK